MRQINLSQPLTTFGFPLDSTMRAEIHLVGGTVLPEHIEMLKDYLDVTLKALRRKVASSSSDDPTQPKPLVTGAS